MGVVIIRSFWFLLLLFASGVSFGNSSYFETRIGIDLGARYSCAGVYRKGKVEIIPNDQGNLLTLAWVAFTDNQTLVGQVAKDQATLNPERTIFDVKRLIGRKFDDPEVQRAVKELPYKIVGKDGKSYVKVKIRDEIKLFSPEEISAMVLRKMKEMSEAYLGKKINDVVLTIPAYFKYEQIKATRAAASMAGLDVRLIMNGAMSAVLAYGLESEDDKNVLVVDLGGGRVDVSILTTVDNVFDVIFTNGDPQLGEGPLTGMDLFEKLIRPLLTALKEANLKKSDIHEIVLVGATSTHFSRVRKLLKDFFDGKKPRDNINPDHVVAHGAAIQGEAIREETWPMIGYWTPLSLGIERMGGLMTKLIPRDTLTPVVKSRIFTTTYDHQTSMSIKVYEGERVYTKDCQLVAAFDISGITPAPKGVAQIEVRFLIDPDIKLHVTAKDKATGISKSITITDSRFVRRREIKEKMKEAKKFMEEDMKTKEEMEATNKLDAHFFNNNDKLADKVDAKDIEDFEKPLKSGGDPLINKAHQKNSTSSAYHELMKSILAGLELFGLYF